MGRIAHRAILALLVSSLIAVNAPLAQYPSWSRERGERYDAWREQIRLAEEAHRQERSDDAEGAFRSVIEQAGAAGDRSLLVARAIDGLADLCREQERMKEAAALYERSAAMWEELLGPLQPRLAITCHNLGTVYLSMGESGRAESSLRKALAIWEQMYGTGSPQAENSRRALRLVARQSGPPQEPAPTP
jgi:tetratricopeptide (TPR) repeat protein